MNPTAILGQIKRCENRMIKVNRLQQLHCPPALGGWHIRPKWSRRKWRGLMDQWARWQAKHNRFRIDYRNLTGVWLDWNRECDRIG